MEAAWDHMAPQGSHRGPQGSTGNGYELQGRLGTMGNHKAIFTYQMRYN